jgi:hypothetical protein
MRTFFERFDGTSIPMYFFFFFHHNIVYSKSPVYNTPRPAISSQNSNDTMSNVLNAVASLAKSYSGLQDPVNQLLKSTQAQKI